MAQRSTVPLAKDAAIGSNILHFLFGIFCCAQASLIPRPRDPQRQNLRIGFMQIYANKKSTATNNTIAKKQSNESCSINLSMS